MLLKEVAGREKGIELAAKSAVAQASPTPASTASAEDAESAESDRAVSSASAAELRPGKLRRSRLPAQSSARVRLPAQSARLAALLRVITTRTWTGSGE